LGKILIVDDDAQLRHSFAKLLSSEGHAVLTNATGEGGLKLVTIEHPDLVIMDVRLPGLDGLQTFKAIHEKEPKLPVIIMTAYSSTEIAIQATKLGAFDYVLKPFDIPEMLSTVTKALEAGRVMRSRVEIDALHDVDSADAIIGKSRPMQEVYKAIGRVASTDATVLIRGESGTGKELVARAIYHHSVRKDKPFLVINCVAIPETLLESELFGYEKGAFTGASHRKFGRIEQADGGTVFLDEIGDMPFSIQAKILRLLQEKSIERLGGHSHISVDVRMIAATNRDLEEALEEGRFRADLYYRLKVVTIWLPPLRERKGDIPMLAEYFLKRCTKDMRIDNPGLTPEAKRILEQYPWPGNVRELANTVQKAIIFSRGSPITGEEIALAVRGEKSPRLREAQGDDEPLHKCIREQLSSLSGTKKFHEIVDRFATILITEALNITNGNRSQAAKLLGMSRPTLLAKIEKYGIKIETAAKAD